MVKSKINKNCNDCKCKSVCHIVREQATFSMIEFEKLFRNRITESFYDDFKNEVVNMFFGFIFIVLATNCDNFINKN